MNTSELFWNASIEELKQGFIETPNEYICLICGQMVEKGIIYPKGDTLYESQKFIKVHIIDNHKSVFDYLINLDKKLTGVTEHQKLLMELFYQGKSDKEIQKDMSISGSSTIRNHRFVLKEKERQAKVFLTLMELLKDKDDHDPNFISVHKNAKMVDQRYNVTHKESQDILKKYMKHGRLSTFDIKEKHKIVILSEIAKYFEIGKNYIEKEVNEILESVYDDYVILRRYLIEYGFMDRKPDGSQYWLKDDNKD